MQAVIIGMATCSNVTMIVLQCFNVTMLHILVILIDSLSHPRDLFEFKSFTMTINNSCLYLMIRVFYQFYKSKVTKYLFFIVVYILMHLSIY